MCNVKIILYVLPPKSSKCHTDNKYNRINCSETISSPLLRPSWLSSSCLLKRYLVARQPCWMTKSSHLRAQSVPLRISSRGINCPVNVKKTSWKYQSCYHLFCHRWCVHVLSSTRVTSSPCVRELSYNPALMLRGVMAVMDAHTRRLVHVAIKRTYIAYEVLKSQHEGSAVTAININIIVSRSAFQY